MENDYHDEELAKDAQNGNKIAFGMLVERYEKKIKQYAKKFLARDVDIEDVVQDIFIKAYININSFDVGRKFSPWIYRIAHNELVNHLKKRERKILTFLDPEVFFPHLTAKERTEQKAEQEEIKEMINACFAEIPLKYREPLILYYLEEFDYKEVSDVLRIPVSTVGVRLKRGKEKMKKACEKLNFEV